MLICHPGGPGFAGAELEDLGGLASTRELLLVDPRGTGSSPRPDDSTAYRTDDYVADLEELREDLALETIDLLGFSHGGVVAIAYAAAHPTRVRKLVLAATLAAITDELAAEIERATSARADEPWFAAAADALEREERGDYDEHDFGDLWGAMAPLYFSRWDERHRPWLDRSSAGSNPAPLRVFNAAPPDLRPDLARVEAETLVVAGADDFICGPVAARTIADGVTAAQLVVLEGSGHMLFLEQPDAFRVAVESFLSG
jgi:proline-specific peptidase